MYKRLLDTRNLRKLATRLDSEEQDQTGILKLTSMVRIVRVFEKIENYLQHQYPLA